MARPKKRRAVRARKNVAFLIPLVPLVAPVAIAGVAVYAGKKWIDQTSKTAKLLLSPVPVVGATAGFVVARSTKQDLSVQAAAVMGGYALGLVVNKLLGPGAEAKAAASGAVAELMATGMTQEQAEAAVQKHLDDAKWCASSPVLSWVSPSCY
jgi:hypothetical protein